MDRDLCVRCNAADVDPFVEQTDRLYNTTHRKFGEAAASWLQADSPGQCYGLPTAYLG